VSQLINHLLTINLNAINFDFEVFKLEHLKRKNGEICYLEYSRHSHSFHQQW